MTETAATPQGVPVITADPFSPENLMQPHPLHEQLREAGPVVYLYHYNIWAMARYEQDPRSMRRIMADNRN